jgi:hypothetical protein
MSSYHVLQKKKIFFLDMIYLLNNEERLGMTLV